MPSTPTLRCAARDHNVRLAVVLVGQRWSLGSGNGPRRFGRHDWCGDRCCRFAVRNRIKELLNKFFEAFPPHLTRHLMAAHHDWAFLGRRIALREIAAGVGGVRTCVVGKPASLARFRSGRPSRPRPGLRVPRTDGSGRDTEGSMRRPVRVQAFGGGCAIRTGGARRG